MCDLIGQLLSRSQSATSYDVVYAQNQPNFRFVLFVFAQVKVTYYLRLHMLDYGAIAYWQNIVRANSLPAQEVAGFATISPTFAMVNGVISRGFGG